MAVSDDTSLTDVVVSEAQQQVDVEGLIDGEGIDEQIDSAELGAAVGGELGESVGRTFGAAIGHRVQDALADVVDRETDTDGLVAELKRAVREGIEDAIDEVRGDESLVASLASMVRERDLAEGVTDVLSGDREDVEDGERAEEEVEEGERAEEAAEEEPRSEEEAEDGDERADDVEEPEELDASDLEDLRRETLAEYLETLSYRDLQHVAKEVDVKANLSRDEMSDRIVDAVSDESAA